MGSLRRPKSRCGLSSYLESLENPLPSTYMQVVGRIQSFVVVKNEAPVSMLAVSQELCQLVVAGIPCYIAPLSSKTVVVH